MYDFRREYNAALVNTGVWKAHKSHRHHDGELCFGGGWFIVMIDTPFGQISNHYENEYWDEFHCEEKKLQMNGMGILRKIFLINCIIVIQIGRIEYAVTNLHYQGNVVLEVGDKS